MDRNNKYYGIIENLVKNHRKFPGLEAIAEDIIEDVYTHAKSVIESIDDEIIIEGYLQKIVSTSLITVPKKLNFHNEQRHHYVQPKYTPITANTDISTSIQTKSEYVEEKPTEKADDIEETEEKQIEAEISENNITEIESQEDLLSGDEDTDLTEFLELNDIDEQEQIQEQEPIQDRPDNSLVDKMINSIAEDTLKDENSSFEEDGTDEDDILGEIAETQTDEADINDLTEDDLVEETSDIEELVNYSDVSEVENLTDLHVEDNVADEAEELIIEDNDNIFELEDSTPEVENSEPAADDAETEAEEKEEETDENIIVEEENDIFLDENEDENELNIDIDDIAEETSLDIIEEDSTEENIIEEEKNTEENNVDFLQEESEPLELSDAESGNTMELESEEETISLEAPSNDELLIAAEDDNSVLEEDDSISIVLDSEDSESDIILDEETEEAVTNNNHDFKPVDYSAFNFNPEEKETVANNDYIAEKLLQTDKDEPGLNMLKIFDLKYKQNLTIEKISELLNIEKQDVVAALDKMTDLI